MATPGESRLSEVSGFCIMPRRGRGRLAYRTRHGNNAPNPISPVPTEYIIGGLDIVCPYCSALHFPGETVGSSCFLADLRTVDDIVCSTFKEAAQRRGLLADDSEWDACLAEAALFQMPCQLRQLFATILIYNNPTDPVSLWTKYKGYLSEDFSSATSDAAAEQMTLRELEFQLRENRLSCHHYGLPAPLTPLLDSGEDHLDVNAELQIRTEMYRSLTPDQKSIVDTIVDSLNVNPRCFFIDGPGGTGKTYVYNTLIHCVRAVGKIVIPLASTGIAATLLSGGQTVHSRFKLPISLLENSVAAISANSSEAELIRRSSLIIWDEAPMAHYRALEIVDRLLKDIMHCDLAFGGKVVVLGGDFRQVLPVVPRASRAEIVAACIKQSKLWPLFVILRLTQNMRAGIDAQSFSQWLLKVGDGDLPTDQQGLISLPESCIFHGVDLVQEIFGSSYGDITALSQSVILTPKNTDSLEINEKVLDRLPNRSQCFLSVDSVECENVEEQNNYPTEFLNSLTPTGMPPHRLNLKIGAIVMLLRNLNPKQGLCNGTRMVIQRMRSHVLEAQILTGTKVGQTVLVPKISLAPSDTNLPFILKRRQFPLRLAFAMTINKAQGQTFARVGLLLHEPVFTHGQLYVAFSRVRTLNSIRVKLNPRLISTLQLVERLDRYPLRNKRKIDSVEPEETSMNVKKEGTQVSNYVVQHLPRNPSIFSGEDGEDLQKWLKGYARVAKYNHWDETLCLTKVYFYLSGTALKWFENNEESIQTWKEFTSQLENVFGKKENSKLQAEKKLKTRAQLKGESTECYIQDLLCLCKEVDPQMSEEDKISHLMKGIAEELYQALLPRDVQKSTEQFIAECRRVEALRCRRVTPTRYERLPNVASLCDQDDGEDLSSMIRQIFREEVQRALGSPREEPKNATIEEIVKEEIGRTLAPISKSRRSPSQKERPRQFLNTRYEAETIRPHPEPRYPKQGGRRDTNDWRTTEGRPICFYCGRPGHVVRYCRDRKRHNEERRNDYFQRKQDAMVSYNSRAESRTQMTNHRGKLSLATEALLHIAVKTDNISHLLEDLAGRPAIKIR
ncbi:hypothetical protein LAZ67_13001669 [Cordylochernes scorpioides]|uniref:ATP-dependent DNA helicase n=1 Tax=Cordylochernes scorpioides TaxID=51811 RepID=A0ABY6L416_9ARAC|nr:hypothetical protein LAZ67_13001669 [Cordylochernes scorpioides]